MSGAHTHRLRRVSASVLPSRPFAISPSDTSRSQRTNQQSTQQVQTPSEYESKWSPSQTLLTPADINSRLYRTCLALLETLHRYCWGALTNYKKRVHHDCLVSREEYQDLYLVLREKYKHLVDQWQEATDPLKHVFEVSLSFLIMLAGFRF